MILTAFLGAARAAQVAVIIGARTEWDPACRPDSGPCAPEHRVQEGMLQYADDDAWRINYLLSGSLPPERRLVFTTPDPDVAARGFGGATVRAATLPEIEASLRAVELDASVEILVFVASHGTREGVHLDDGVVSLEALEARLESSGGTVTALLADSCLSARWDGARDRGAFFPTHEVLEFPEIQHGVPYLRAAVDEATQELPSLHGGLYTHVLSSALIGGADRDEDGLVDAQELSDFAHGYRAAFGATYVPFVAAPSAHTTLTAFAGPARLVLGDEDESARWYLTVRFGAEDVLLAELYTVRGARVEVGLPPGEVSVWRVPYRLEPGQSRERRVGEVGTRCAVTLVAGESRDFPDCGQTFRVGGTRGAVVEGTASEPALDWIVLGGAFAPEPVPANAVHYHGGQKWILGAGVTATTGVLSRSGGMAGPALSALWTGVGRVHLSFGAEARIELGAGEPARAYAALARARIDGAAWSSTTHRLGLGAGVAVGGLFVLEPWPAGAPMVELSLGPRWSGGRVELVGGWTPTLYLLDVDQSAERTPTPEIGRAGVSVIGSFP